MGRILIADDHDALRRGLARALTTASHEVEEAAKKLLDVPQPPTAGARAPMHLLFGELDGNGRYYGSDAQRSPLDRYRSPGAPPYTGG